MAHVLLHGAAQTVVNRFTEGPRAGRLLLDRLSGGVEPGVGNRCVSNRWGGRVDGVGSRLVDAAQVVVERFSPGDEDVGGGDLLVVAFGAGDPTDVVMGVFRMASSDAGNLTKLA